MTRWQFTHHALMRGVEMCLSAQEILETLDSPRAIYEHRPTTDQARRQYPGEVRKVYQGPGRISAVVSEGTRTVITLIYTHGSAGARNDLTMVRDRGVV